MVIISDRERLLRMENYPGMIPAESRVLRQFIRAHGARFDEFRFNVRIGEGVDPGPNIEIGLRRAWQQITKARPDTVAYKHPHDATLIEVKEAFTNEAVWQLLAYRDLYMAAFPNDRVRLVGVAQLAPPTARALASSQGIAVVLYTFSSPAVDVGEVATEIQP